MRVTDCITAPETASPTPAKIASKILGIRNSKIILLIATSEPTLIVPSKKRCTAIKVWSIPAFAMPIVVKIYAHTMVKTAKAKINNCFFLLTFS